MDLIWLATALPLAVICLLGWFTFRLGSRAWRNNGELLDRVEGLESQARDLRRELFPETEPKRLEPLPIGTDAPAFELPDLNYGQRLTSLAQFRGSRVLLIFFGANCGFCDQLAPRLATLAPDGKGAPLELVVISSGGAKANAKFIELHHVRCPLLLDGEKQEVAQAYQVDGTPEAYLIDAEGKIASARAVGEPEIFQLLKKEVPAA